MQIDKPTLVLGASENPERYSNKAMRMLQSRGHSVSAVGLRNGVVNDMLISTMWPKDDIIIDTITIYLSPKNQDKYIGQILAQHPNRVIFNPGTENADFYALLDEKKIEYTEACTLVLLQTNQY